jgi:ABC-type molybdate transport system substrate-binding protein
VVFEIPADDAETVRYPILLIKRPASQRTADAFYNCLGSPEATKVFEKYGFNVLTGTGDDKK